MSGLFYDNLWHLAQHTAGELLTLDKSVLADKTPKRRHDAVKKILPIYIKYRNLVKKLAQLCDLMIHSQKRELIKRLFDCSVGRMLEYRKEIVKLTCSDYQWPDDLLIDLKWTPDDIEIPQISSYTADRKNELEGRKRIIQDLMTKLDACKTEAEAEDEVEGQLPDNEIPNVSELTRAPSMVRRRKSMKIIATPQLPKESEEARIAREKAEALKKAFSDAILLIQRHERARQGRVIGTNANRDYKYQERLKLGEIELKKYKRKMRDRASTTIQRVWRGYKTRKFLAKHREETEMALGMIVPSRKDKTVFEEDLRNRSRIQELQEQFKTAVQEKIDEERAKIFKDKAVDTMDDITEEIRAWFQEWLSVVGHFDIYPPEQNGGSVLVTTGQTLTPEEFLAKKLEEENKIEEKKNAKDKKGKEKDKKAAKDKEKDEGWVMPESKVLQTIVDVQKEFLTNWSLRNENLSQVVNTDMIKEEIFHELQLEMRKAVDELMRLELDRMNDALIKDHKDDDPKFEFPGMKKGKTKKKGKKGGKKKKKKKGEETANKDEVDEMFRELVSSGIIQNYPEVKLDDWFGDLSYQNFEAHRDLKDYKHRLGEVKSVIKDTCILPLGSRGAHMVAPLIRSVCITGLPRTGKTFLAHAIANEIGALLFDLTPSVLAGQYEGKENEKRLMKMINTVAKNYPPSIVLIDGGEKPWWKKIPPEEKENQPKRLAKLLPKFIKGIKPGDQILVLGLASEPWKTKKKFYKIYETFVIIPVSDYNSVYLSYQEILMKYHNINRHFDISSLAQASVGYSLDVIREAVESVLNLKRRMRLKFEPLKPEEILNELQKHPSTSQKTVDEYAKFQMKTPIGRKWVKMMKEERGDISEPKGKKKK